MVGYWGVSMNNLNKLPKDFFTKERSIDKTSSTKENKKDDYSKIEEIKWNKDILSGKTKIVGSLPKNNKML